MYPHEKPGYVDACRAAGVCPSVINPQTTGVVFCDREHSPVEKYRVHLGFSDTLHSIVRWDDEDCAPLEGGS